jgi:hypothetical protein
MIGPESIICKICKYSNLWPHIHMSGCDKCDTFAIFGGDEGTWGRRVQELNKLSVVSCRSGPGSSDRRLEDVTPFLSVTVASGR